METSNETLDETKLAPCKRARVQDEIKKPECPFLKMNDSLLGVLTSFADVDDLILWRLAHRRIDGAVRLHNQLQEPFELRCVDFGDRIRKTSEYLGWLAPRITSFVTRATTMTNLNCLLTHGLLTQPFPKLKALDIDLELADSRTRKFAVEFVQQFASVLERLVVGNTDCPKALLELPFERLRHLDIIHTHMDDPTFCTAISAGKFKACFGGLESISVMLTLMHEDAVRAATDLATHCPKLTTIKADVYRGNLPPILKHIAPLAGTLTDVSLRTIDYGMDNGVELAALRNVLEPFKRLHKFCLDSALADHHPILVPNSVPHDKHEKFIATLTSMILSDHEQLESFELPHREPFDLSMFLFMTRFLCPKLEHLQLRGHDHKGARHQDSKLRLAAIGQWLSGHPHVSDAWLSRELRTFDGTFRIQTNDDILVLERVAQIEFDGVDSKTPVGMLSLRISVDADDSKGKEHKISGKRMFGCMSAFRTRSRWVIDDLSGRIDCTDCFDGVVSSYKRNTGLYTSLQLNGPAWFGADALQSLFRRDKLDFSVSMSIAFEQLQENLADVLKGLTVNKIEVPLLVGPIHLSITAAPPHWIATIAESVCTFVMKCPLKMCVVVLGPSEQCLRCSNVRV